MMLLYRTDINPINSWQAIHIEAEQTKPSSALATAAHWCTAARRRQALLAAVANTPECTSKLLQHIQVCCLEYVLVALQCHPILC